MFSKHCLHLIPTNCILQQAEKLGGASCRAEAPPPRAAAPRQHRVHRRGCQAYQDLLVRGCQPWQVRDVRMEDDFTTSLCPGLLHPPPQPCLTQQHLSSKLSGQSCGGSSGPRTLESPSSLTQISWTRSPRLETADI